MNHAYMYSSMTSGAAIRGWYCEDEGRRNVKNPNQMCRLGMTTPQVNAYAEVIGRLEVPVDKAIPSGGGCDLADS